jgi:hypothetical protein
MKVLKFLWKGMSELNRAGIWDALRPYAIGDFGTAIGHLYPELKGQDDLMRYVMSDIRNRGFSTIAGPTDSFPQSPGITNMGVEFLNFVLEPPRY